MIRLSIKGRIAKKERIEKYIQTALLDMMPRLKRLIEIDLNVVTKCDDNNYALCWGDKNIIEIELARTSGDIKFTHDEMMLNLAHEIVHAKQFIKGELHPTLQKWKKFKKDYAKTPYFKTPWEKEAYLMEDKIFNKYWKNG
jgi:ribonuclease HII